MTTTDPMIEAVHAARQIDHAPSPDDGTPEHTAWSETVSRISDALREAKPTSFSGVMAALEFGAESDWLDSDMATHFFEGCRDFLAKREADTSRCLAASIARELVRVYKAHETTEELSAKAKVQDRDSDPVARDGVRLSRYLLRLVNAGAHVPALSAEGALLQTGLIRQYAEDMVACDDSQAARERLKEVIFFMAESVAAFLVRNLAVPEEADTTGYLMPERFAIEDLVRKYAA